MLDRQGRTIDYLRLSLTDRCNLRCVYCLPERDPPGRAGGPPLSLEEILRLGRVFASLGIRKIKLTGGEPLLRPDLPGLIAGLKAIDGVARVTLTTNGALLAERIQALCAAGLDAVNVSVDTLDPGRYRRLTRSGTLSRALGGVDAALAHRPGSVKINCVATSERDVVEVAGLARRRDLPVRFIEMMPIGPGANFERIDAARVRRLLEASHGPMTPAIPPLGNGPARYFSLPGFAGKIGLIDAVSRGFCESCNRVRLTGDGWLKPCLAFEQGADLRGALRAGDDGALAALIRGAVAQKPPGHAFFQSEQPAPPERRTMSQIGG